MGSPVTLPSLKRKLTMAIKSQDYHKIINVVNDAMEVFEIQGYPDQWYDWSRAKNDAEYMLKFQEKGLRL